MATTSTSSSRMGRPVATRHVHLVGTATAVEPHVKTRDAERAATPAGAAELRGEQLPKLRAGQRAPHHEVVEWERVVERAERHRAGWQVGAKAAGPAGVANRRIRARGRLAKRIGKHVCQRRFLGPASPGERRVEHGAQRRGLQRLDARERRRHGGVHRFRRNHRATFVEGLADGCLAGRAAALGVFARTDLARRKIRTPVTCTAALRPSAAPDRATVTSTRLNARPQK